jgi:hypothetical protein
VKNSHILFIFIHLLFNGDIYHAVILRKKGIDHFLVYTAAALRISVSGAAVCSGYKTHVNTLAYFSSASPRQ